MLLSAPQELPSIEEAKDRLGIPDLWRRLGLPGTPAPTCRCPWREDRRPSFSITPNGRLWHDFTTGKGGDAVDFLAHALGVPDGIAVRRFREMADGLAVHIPAAMPVQEPTPRRPFIPPAWHEGSTMDRAALARIRAVRIEAIRIAVERGLVRFGEWRGRRSWFVTDPAGRCAQARRLDGQPWEEIEAKAWTLPGSQATWPAGIGAADRFPVVALVEGGPDLLAAIHFAWCEGAEDRTAPVAMLGAGLRIAADALPQFAGKRVRLFPHADPAGHEAGERWALQLSSVGAVVDAFRISGLRMRNGGPAKDLNDLTQVHPDDFEEHRALWSLMP